MKNRLLVVLSISAVSILGLVITSSVKSKKNIQSARVDTNNFNQAAANTYNDNIRAFSAQLIEVKRDNKKLKQEIARLERSNNGLSSHGTDYKASKATELLERKIQRLTEDLDKFKSEQQKHEKEAVNNASPNGNGYKIASISSMPRPQMQYVVDVDKLEHKGSFLNHSNFEKINPSKYTSHSKADVEDEFSNKKSNGIPYYTLPAGSDLTGTTLLSALIGEVPLDNKLAQPLFPFSAMVGRGSLMAANGVPLPPDIKGMKVGGYAIGVGSFLDDISCARAYVTSALFVFQDGHFETVGEEKMHNANQMVDSKAIGYLTNRYGNPCIRGTYFTNAPRVLAAMGGAAGVQGAGQSLSQWQMSYFANANGGAALPTGSLGKYALGSAISQGSIRAAEWLENRVKGSFDMVFVPASIPYRQGKRVVFQPNRLTLHLTKTIEINKDTRGRRISYGKSQSSIHDYSLD